MNSPPLVTIITPAYNRAELLAETIESVLAQDYPNLEYIVLDDGSSDDTPAVLRRYDGRLRWEHHANMGETRTVNRGFELAQGELIGVVNSDDPLLPGALTRLVAVIQESPEVMVVYPDWQMIDGQGRVMQTIRSREYTGCSDMVRRHLCLPGPGALFRRELLLRLGGRDPLFRYVADMDFWFRAALCGELRRVPEVLATFRVHAGGLTVGARGEAMAMEHVRVVEKLYSLPQLPDEVLAVKREASGSAYFVGGMAFGRGSFREKTRYFARAVTLAPRKYCGEYAFRWMFIFSALLNVSNVDFYYRLKRVQERWFRWAH